MSLVQSVKAEFHKSPLLAASAVAAVVGAVVLARKGSAGGAISPLDSAFNPQGSLAGGGGGGGGAGLGQGDPAIGLPTQNVPVQTGTAVTPITPGVSASDVAAAINQAISGLGSAISDSQSQLQGEINQLAGAVSRSQSLGEAPRVPLATGPSQQDMLLQQLLSRVSALEAPQIAPQAPTATPQITAAPRDPTVAIDGQTLAGQSAQTQSDFRATFGAGAAQAWVQQHEQELLHPKPVVLPAFSATPAPLPAPRMADPTGGLIANPIPGVDYGPLFKPQPTPMRVVDLPQVQNPLPNVDYGPTQISHPAGPAPGSQAAANEARFIAQQAANPTVNQATPQPARFVDTESQPAPAIRTRVTLE